MIYYLTYHVPIFIYFVISLFVGLEYRELLCDRMRRKLIGIYEVEARVPSLLSILLFLTLCVLVPLYGILWPITLIKYIIKSIFSYNFYEVIYNYFVVMYTIIFGTKES